MAITCKELDILIYLKKNGYLNNHSSIIEIGAQQIANNFLEASDKLYEIADLFSINKMIDLPQLVKGHMAHGLLEHLKENAIHARKFWEWLKFQYTAVDIDGSPDSIPLDLNFDAAPKKLKGQYDLVTNLGTTEHLVNQLNAFQVIHELTKVGGIMIHTLPSQGMINHGLINYNPKFFWMLARSNGYKWVYSDYTTSTAYYDLPENIVDCMLPYNPSIVSQKKEYHLADCGLVVVMQKTYDSPYVPALDVPTGANPTNKTLAKRYWSVFQPDAFYKYHTQKNLPKAAFTSRFAKKILKIFRLS